MRKGLRVYAIVVGDKILATVYEEANSDAVAEILGTAAVEYLLQMGYKIEPPYRVEFESIDEARHFAAGAGFKFAALLTEEDYLL